MNWSFKLTINLEFFVAFLPRVYWNNRKLPLRHIWNNAATVPLNFQFCLPYERNFLKALLKWLEGCTWWFKTCKSLVHSSRGRCYCRVSSLNLLTVSENKLSAFPVIILALDTTLVLIFYSFWDLRTVVKEVNRGALKLKLFWLLF